MSLYYLHDGQNELGPFTLEQLRNQKLSKNSPVRRQDTDAWHPAQKMDGLKDLVASRKIRKPRDIVPVMMEQVVEMRRSNPRLLYGIFTLILMVAGVSVYTVTASRDITAEESTGDQDLPAGEYRETKLVRMVTPAEPIHSSTLISDSSAYNLDVEKPKPVDRAQFARQRWNKLITVSNSNYGIGVLGGIKDLSISVRNRSEFKVDLAVVKVTYFKPNGEVWKSKLVEIKGIPPRETAHQLIEDVNRGKRVKVSLQKIVSSEMNFSYTEGEKGKSKGDPYFTG